MTPKIGLVLTCASVLALGACGSNNNKKSEKGSAPSQNPAMSAKKTGAPGAKVSFIAPKSGSTVKGPVVVRVKLSGFKLAPQAVGKRPVAGEGHLHFSMDEGKYDQPKYSGANGKLAVKLGVNGKYSPSTTPTITYKGLPAGKHTLEVYLANNDHSNTGVEGKTSFTVK